MKTNYRIALSLFAIFTALIYIFYFFEFSKQLDTVFITMLTFLFAILAGFFIARQNARYSRIEEEIANFDGNLSSIYRAFGHLGREAQLRAASIIENHYRLILENHQWDYPITHKTTTLTKLHEELENSITDKTIVGILSGITISLRDNQLIRKRLVALHKERVPKFQWFLICVLPVILLLAIATVSSRGFFLASAIKSAFVVAIIAVIILLRQLDKLKLLEGVIGEDSARDVVDIINERK